LSSVSRGFITAQASNYFLACNAVHYSVARMRGAKTEVPTVSKPSTT
jgi:hypothetical protein